MHTLNMIQEYQYDRHVMSCADSGVKQQGSQWKRERQRLVDRRCLRMAVPGTHIYIYIFTYFRNRQKAAKAAWLSHTFDIF